MIEPEGPIDIPDDDVSPPASKPGDLRRSVLLIAEANDQAVLLSALEAAVASVGGSVTFSKMCLRGAQFLLMKVRAVSRFW